MVHGIMKYSLLLLSCAFSVYSAPLQAVRTERAPVIDGFLEDEVWGGIPGYSSFIRSGNAGAAKAPTLVKFAYDNNALYVGIKAEVPKTSPADADNQQAESVEIMIDPGAARNNYLHLTVTRDGTKSDELSIQGGFVSNSNYDAIWAGEVFSAKKYWSCECRIPFASLDFPAGDCQTWAVNVVRNATIKDGTAEISTITPDGSVNIAGNFPELTGFNRSFSPYFGLSIGTPVIDTGSAGDGIALTAAVDLSNRNNTARNVSVSLDLVHSVSKEGFRKTTALTLPPNSMETVVFKNFVLREEGEYKGVAAIRDSRNKRLLKQIPVAVNVKYTPLKLRLEEPWYKDAIFATMTIPEVRYTVEIPLDKAKMTDCTVESGITDAEGKILVSGKSPASETMQFSFPAAELPEGRMNIFAKLADPKGNTTAEITHRLRKLPRKQGEVWLDKNGDIYLDGKPFFTIAQWTSRDDFLPGTNLFLDWESFRGTRIISPLFSHKAELKAMRKKQSLSSDDINRASELLAKEMQKEMLFCYLLADEPEVFSDTVEAMTMIYNLIDEMDPWHPVLINNSTEDGLLDYADTADLNGAHAYPRPARDRKFANFEKLPSFFDKFCQVFSNRSHRQSMLWMAHGFDSSNYAAVNTRIPSYTELRNENIMALISGAKGILHYNTLNQHDPEIGIGLAELNKELTAYSAAMISPNHLKPELSPSAGFRVAARQVGGELWIFAANFSDKGELLISLPELGSRKLKVMAENRSLQAVYGTLKDSFDAYQVHVYTTDMNAPDLRSAADVEKEIEKIHASQHKPGNLAYQRHEGTVLELTASSNRAFNRRADNCLWHVTDGVIEPESFNRYNDQQVVWCDTTPNQAPDWIELKFHNQITAGKVAVSTVENTLKDYEIQVWINNKWVTVAKIEDESGLTRTHSFNPVKTDRIRLFVTGTRGPCVRISEIEVYEH